MQFYVIEESGADTTIEALDWEDALEKARDWAADGSYDERVVVTVTVEALEDDEDEGIEAGEAQSTQVEAGPEPEAPVCEGGELHDWQRPHAIVGGIESNPGVWATGGTSFLLLEVCAHCGRYRETHASGAQRNPGELPERVTYPDADDASLAYAASC